MNRTERIAEIKSRITAFENEKYEKAEYLPELLKLQGQMASVVFNEENSEARVWDVYKQLNILNSESNNVVAKELEKLKYDCRVLDNRIKSEISGNKGEYYTLNALERLNPSNIIFRNVEIEVDGERTEIDFLVITRKAVFILEVKNSIRDILITKDGGFYREGNRQSYDCNIRTKMKLREELLTKVLNNAGISRVNIVNLVVFTNNRIHIKNDCEDVKISFLGQLPYKIDEYYGWKMYSEEDVNEISDAISSANSTNDYSFDVDVNVLKNDLAEVMVSLEEYNEKPHGFINTIKSIFNLKAAGKSVA